jgi:hypothetical protein
MVPKFQVDDDLPFPIGATIGGSKNLVSRELGVGRRPPPNVLV